jgi:hypothetical protein
LSSSISKKKPKVEKDGLTKDQRDDYIRRAKYLHHEEGTLEIDDNAEVSTGMDKGVYVQAWVWVPDQEEEIPYG